MEQREIKFRVWSCGYMDYDVMVDSFGAYGEPDKKYDTPHKEVEAYASPVLMQYTGLKDKNGKEIYEGDIVKDDSTTFKIEWYKGRFDFVRVKGCYQQPYFGDNCSRMEIIGNVYEHPHFLTPPSTTN